MRRQAPRGQGRYGEDLGREPRLAGLQSSLPLNHYPQSAWVLSPRNTSWGQCSKDFTHLWCYRVAVREADGSSRLSLPRWPLPRRKPAASGQSDGLATHLPWLIKVSGLCDGTEICEKGSQSLPLCSNSCFPLGSTCALWFFLIFSLLPAWRPSHRW